jgi:hypothetical protein
MPFDKCRGWFRNAIYSMFLNVVWFAPSNWLLQNPCLLDTCKRLRISAVPGDSGVSKAFVSEMKMAQNGLLIGNTSALSHGPSLDDTLVGPKSNSDGSRPYPLESL